MASRTKLLAAAAASAALTAGMVVLPATPVSASSHREAPMISADPVADNTDLYMFRDVADPTMVNIVANYIGFEPPQGGPNWARFGDDVAYEIHIDNNHDVVSDITFQFRFRTVVTNPDTFLYNTGRITDAGAPPQNVRQLYSVQRMDAAGHTMLAVDLETPPVNIGPRSTPNYPSLAAETVSDLPGGGQVFAGQRDDPFFADTGSIFDLLALRPIQSNHVIGTPGNTDGVDGLGGFNVHTIALQVPIASVSAGGGMPTVVDDPASVIGAYASSSRQRVRVLSVVGGAPRDAGRWIQVSRLGLPLINEVLIPLGAKDAWNASDPANDVANFGRFILDPEPTRLLPVLYPDVFNDANTPDGGIENRPDLVALLTGQLIGLSEANAVPPADLLRINLAAAPTGSGAAFPNGRQLEDDVVDIELQVLAGAFLDDDGIIDGTDLPYSILSDGVGYLEDGADELATFPYVGTPFSGYEARFYGTAP